MTHRTENLFRRMPAYYSTRGNAAEVELRCPNGYGGNSREGAWATNLNYAKDSTRFVQIQRAANLSQVHRGERDSPTRWETRRF
jgi:hypothetical protein